MPPRHEALNLSAEQHIAVEIMGMKPRLRSDLTISVQEYAGQVCYVIEDPWRSKFFRLGISEYTFVSLLDGATTIAEAMSHTASLAGADALTEHDCGNLCKWLIDSGLTITEQVTTADRMTETRSRVELSKWMGAANPMIQKLPLLNPMTFLRPLDGISRVVFGPLGFAIWFLVCATAIGLLLSRQDLLSAVPPVFSRSNWLWLLATGAVLKLMHELSHALACRRFSGTVREAGIVFVLLAPMPYVDVTSAWRLDSKYKRILISGAGMLAEIFIAAWAAIVWSQTHEVWVQQHCFNIMVAATVVTLVFNANPLMRFDGYYILADLIELPNLAAHAKQWTSAATRRYLLGQRVRQQKWPEGKAAIVIGYAIAACVWRLVVCVSLLLAAEILLHGAGLVLALLGFGIWFVWPFAKFLISLRDGARTSPVRLGSSIALSTLGVVALWTVVPWYSPSTVPIIVDFGKLHEVRCGASGFLADVHARVGDTVQVGQPLARLRNRELEMEIEDLRIDIQLAEQRSRVFRFEEEIAAAQVEERNLVALRKRLNELNTQAQQLVIRAPRSGLICGVDVQHKHGTYLQAGERLYSIGDPEQEAVYGLADQRTAEALRARVGQTVMIHVWGSGSYRFPAQIDTVLPRASADLQHIALGSHAGGPLDVLPQGDATHPPHDSPNNASWKLTEPRFQVHFKFAGCVAHSVYPGQTGYVKMLRRDETAGRCLWRSLQNWIRHKRQLLTAMA